MVLLKDIATPTAYILSSVFTFQYGSIKGYRRGRYSKKIYTIYIPIWFY